MQKKRIALLLAMLALFLISIYAVFAELSVPAVGSGSCVTVAQARAQGIQGTDAELRSKGFCGGSEEPAPVITQDKNWDELQQQYDDYACRWGGRSGQDPSICANIEAAMDNFEFPETPAETVKTPVETPAAGTETETNWYNEVMDTMQSVPESRLGQAQAIYDEFYDEFNKLEIEKVRSWTLEDPDLDKCVNACGENPMFVSINPGDIDLDNPDAVYQDHDAAVAAWKACFDKCNAEDKAREDAENKQFFDKKKALADKAIADINALKGSSGTPSIDLGTFNTNDDRGRDEFGRMKPSIEGYLGNAYVERADGTKVIPGHELYLKVGDSVVCGQKGNINIMFSNAGRINLGPNTVVRVGNALLDQYYLAKGTLKSKLQMAQPGKFEIRTPNAKIFTKGTEYVVDYNETANTTTIYLNEGILEISIANRNESLAAGNYMIIYANGTAITGSLEAESWNALGDNFYEPSNAKFSKLAWALIFLELAALIILRSWADKKIKAPDKKDNSTGKGTASLVLGIVGIALSFAPYLGILASGIALPLARMQKANTPTKSAKWGYVLAIIGLILNAVAIGIAGLRIFIA